MAACTVRAVHASIFHEIIQELGRRHDTCYEEMIPSTGTGRALMIFRAGFALNIVGSFVNGLMPHVRRRRHSHADGSASGRQLAGPALLGCRTQRCKGTATEVRSSA